MQSIILLIILLAKKTYSMSKLLYLIVCPGFLTLLSFLTIPYLMCYKHNKKLDFLVSALAQAMSLTVVSGILSFLLTSLTHWWSWYIWVINYYWIVILLSFRSRSEEVTSI